MSMKLSEKLEIISIKITKKHNKFVRKNPVLWFSIGIAIMLIPKIFLWWWSPFFALTPYVVIILIVLLANLLKEIGR